MLHARNSSGETSNPVNLKAITFRDIDRCPFPRQELCFFSVYMFADRGGLLPWNNSPPYVLGIAVRRFPQAPYDSAQHVHLLSRSDVPLQHVSRWGPGVTRCPLDDDTVVWHNSGLQGRYANSFRIGFNALEFMIDFAQSSTNHRVAEAHTRIIMNPAYGRVLSHLLIRAIEQYEQAHGQIAADQDV